MQWLGWRASDEEVRQAAQELWDWKPTGDVTEATPKPLGEVFLSKDPFGDWYWLESRHLSGLVKIVQRLHQTPIRKELLASLIEADRLWELDLREIDQTMDDELKKNLPRK